MKKALQTVRSQCRCRVPQEYLEEACDCETARECRLTKMEQTNYDTHTILTPEDCKHPAGSYCPTCDGGLAFCVVCKGGEQELLDETCEERQKHQK